ncbi:MAG TPA: hypothetical protein VFQ87_06190 [Bradyrhizobium sp.]|jgi:acetyl-CoA synthetase|nr:hypothetical protein [Bradyrhizobium sp.]
MQRRPVCLALISKPGSLGDTSTLADPAVVDDLVKNRQNKKGAGA